MKAPRFLSEFRRTRQAFVTPADVSARSVPLVFAEPWWVGALVVLVVNDFVFKQTACLPGWFTGKASDFALLAVAPPLLAALLRCQNRWTIGLCHLAVALVFTAIKTSHTMSNLLVEALSFLHAGNRVDPTDLLALSVVPFAFWLTDRAATRVERPSRGRRKFELVLAISGAVACAADSDPDPYGEDGGSGGSGGETASTGFQQIAQATSTGSPAYQCSDGVEDGDETGVDCGGGTCHACAIGMGCDTPSDCISQVCEGDTCASCMFDSQCEADHFCNVEAGGVCRPRGDDGQGCTTDDQCGSGHCVEGVCCNAPCGGNCESCRASHTGASEGVCGPILAGQDPKSACDDSPCATGACDGNGACGFKPSGAQCANATCSNDAMVHGECDASHACNDVPTACPAHLGCFGSAQCALTCGYNGVAPGAASAGCAAGYFCDTVPATPACVLVTKSAGAPCVNHYECASGLCTGGTCN